jgi:hypothetical protein
MRPSLIVAALALAAAPSCRHAPEGGPPDREAGIRACVILEGCGYDSVGSFATNLVCSDRYLGAAYGLRTVVEPVRDCVLAAAGAGDPCPGVAACLNLGDPPAPCTGSATSCAGDVVVGCALGGTTAFDCGAGAHTCVPTAAGGAECGVEACDLAAYAQSCDGTSVLQCDGGGVVSPIDCGASGLVCTLDDATGTATCAGAGDTCDEATYADSCAGSVLRYCIGGTLAEVDCAGLVEGYVCGEVAPGALDCIPPAGTCTDIADDDCDGTTILLCVDQRLWSYDCAALGFAGCTIVDNQPYCY